MNKASTVNENEDAAFPRCRTDNASSSNLEHDGKTGNDDAGTSTHVDSALTPTQLVSPNSTDILPGQAGKSSVIKKDPGDLAMLRSVPSAFSNTDSNVKSEPTRLQTLISGKEEDSNLPKSPPHPLHQLSDLASQQLATIEQLPSKSTSRNSKDIHIQHRDIQNKDPTLDKIPSSASSQGAVNPSQDERIETQNPKRRSTKPKKDKANLRKGKWTVEEEEFTTRIIQHFRTGLLSLPDGHTLRSYLAEKLNCDPMRITKKFSGQSCLGKRVYNLCDRSQVNARDLELANAELRELERRFRLRIEHGNSVPLPALPAHMSEFGKFRNARSSVEAANLMTAGYMLGINNAAPGQSMGRTMDLNAFGSPSSAFGNHGQSLSFLQSLANHHQQHQSPQSFQGNAFHYPMQPQSQQANQFMGDNMAPFISIKQPIGPNLLSALIAAQSSTSASAHQANNTTHPFANQLHPDALKVIPQAQSSSLSSQISGQSMLHSNRAQNNTSFSNFQMQSGVPQQGSQQIDAPPHDRAMEALAATYSTAAASPRKLQQHTHIMHQQQQHTKSEQQDEETLQLMKTEIQNSSSPKKMMNQDQRSTSIESQLNLTRRKRTKEDEAAGRALLGLQGALQELQQNHKKACKAAPVAHLSISSIPQLQSTSAGSTDGTWTTRGSSISSKTESLNGTPSAWMKKNKDSQFKRGFDISVTKNHDLDAASSLSGFTGSVTKGEPLFGSSGGSSGDNDSSSSDGNQDHLQPSGDDTDQGQAVTSNNRSIGPLRKRFRRAERSIVALSGTKSGHHETTDSEVNTSEGLS